MAKKTEEQPKDFTEIGGSPVPGLTLRQVLRGHTGVITRIAWSPDGRYLASPSTDETIRIWNVQTGRCVRILEGHESYIHGVVWSPDGRFIGSCSPKYLIIWNTENWQPNSIPAQNNNNYDIGLAWSPNSMYLASGFKKGNIKIYRENNGVWSQTVDLEGHRSYVRDLDWSPNGKLASASNDKTIRIWDIQTGICEKVLSGHNGFVWSVLWISNTLVISGSFDNTVQIWDTTTGKRKGILEGHTSPIIRLSKSNDNRLLFTKSGTFDADKNDDRICIWDLNTLKQISCLQEICNTKAPFNAGSVAFHPKLFFLATLGSNDTIIRIWELDEAVLLGQAKENVNYTTAKLVLVGDSGVGKTGLGWRLAHGEFKEHASTHGQQFWAIPELGLKRKDGTDCEAVLWDLAGQPVYRQIHSIFLENITAALVLFDANNRQDPLKGVQFWLEQLKGKGQLPPTVLVGGRVDVSPPALSKQEYDQFCQRYEITGGYISTSAKKDKGLDELLDILKKQIPWDEMTATVTTTTFKRIKDYVLSLKEKTDRKSVLVSPTELRKLLEKTHKPSRKKGKILESWEFTDAEMMTAVGHLDTHGFVSVLHNSSGEQYILLKPDILVNLAASIMLLADKNPKELGSISETELLKGKVTFDELKGLAKAEQQILLDAAILRFLEHSICFRETLDSGDTLLIFPSLIKQKRPLQDDLPATDDISYVVRGRVENLYASLVVLLGYTPSFSRINQWQNQAQYEMGAGEICGFRMIEEREGEIELVLYYDDKMPSKGREKYQELFEQFLYQRDVEVTRFPPVICKNGHQQKRATVIDRVREGKTFVFCDECGDKTLLPDFEKPQTIGIGASAWLQVEEATARLRSSYEVHLTRVKSYRRAWATPRCYFSHLPEQSDWAKKLIHDLQDAGVYIIAEAVQVKPDDFLILLDTSAYRKAFQSSASSLAADSQLVKSRLANGNKKVIALLCEGNASEHDLDTCKPGDFCDETHYPISLFDLILNLYTIPFNHVGFAPLRQKLHEQWENTLAGKKRNDMTALKIFISYSHKDEPFKDELVTMLAGLQRRGIVDAWNDRRIEAGDEWYKSIQDAMDDCDLALLLVSPDYLASRFIQEDEQPKLLKRRKEMETRVIPIVIRPCLWQSEETLSSIQSLPRDGKAVITFSKENGDRDQVWADIASVIEKRAKSKS